MALILGLITAAELPGPEIVACTTQRPRDDCRDAGGPFLHIHVAVSTRESRDSLVLV